MHWLLDPEIWLSLLTLTGLEIVLGIDNVIMITVMVSRLPKNARGKARIFGLALAMVTRIALLVSISWMMGLTKDLFTLFGIGFSGRDLLLFFGGLFLIWKAGSELFNDMRHGHHDDEIKHTKSHGVLATVVLIALIDIVFSLDSVITAVGMAQHLPVMIAAIIIAVLVMMAASGAISAFIERHPSLKVLALAFLVVVGAVLMVEACGLHVPKTYIYFALGFALAVDIINIRVRIASQKARRAQRPAPGLALANRSASAGRESGPWQSPGN